MTIQEFIKEEDARFNAIVLANKEPQVKIEDAAKAIGVTTERLRNAIAAGSCPFGFMARASATAKRYPVIQRRTLIGQLEIGRASCRERV